MPPSSKVISLPSSATNGALAGLALSANKPGGTSSSSARPSTNTKNLTPPTSTASSSSALRTATSISDIQAALSALHIRESAILTHLGTLLDSHADLNRNLLRLDSLRAALGAQAVVARSISDSMLTGTADAAGWLSDHLRAMDLEKSRIEDTLRVVEQVAELKACVAGVVGSMGAPQDWETAAGYIARASRIPDEIVRSGFANAVVPTVEVPDEPAVTLETARESLCGLFLREFEKAAKDGDVGRVTRFFKLFPLIGRVDVGLDAYGRYVRQGVVGTARAVLKEGIAAEAARRDGFFYPNALTKLFEHIAQIVDGHGGLVERHYSTGRMVRVIEELQMEVDIQGGIILDSWSDERGVDRKLTDMKSYPFSFLAQGLPSQKGITGTSRVNSPSLGGGSNNLRATEDEGIDTKEVDTLLSEIAVMLGRWSLYLRFIAGKCRESQALEDTALSVPDILVRSNLYRKVAEKLINPYNAMSIFLFRRSVEKALQLNELPGGLSLSMSKPIHSTPPYIISAVDDIMYVVDALIRRSISTSQPEVVGSVASTITRILEYDFIGRLRKKVFDESYPKPVSQGGLPPEDKIISFVVLLNSLDIATEYLARIISNQLGPSTDQPNGTSYKTLSVSKESFPFKNDVIFVTNALHKLNTSFTSKITELHDEGIQILFNQIVKPRLRPVLTDTFRNADYILSEEELAELAAQDDEDGERLDQVPRRFEHGWDAIIRPIVRITTPKTFANLLDVTAKYLSRVLEKHAWSYAGRITAYGAIRMERDLGGIVGAVARHNFALREVFGKTMQILTVANMEQDEWEELRAEEIDGAGMVWLLSEEEKTRARNLVRD